MESFDRIMNRADRLREYVRRKGVTPYAIRRFRQIVYEHYRAHGRNLPWRRTRDPYRILVAEIMLQQTQVPRVCDKYPEFLRAFPTFTALAHSRKDRLLRVWQGMGYNRRALSLQRTARAVIRNYAGRLPDTMEELVTLPGIGPATAADILAFAFNKPALVIETNIRAVFIHLFLSTKRRVTDAEIAPLVERTLDRKNPCDWYNALMDFGTALKKSHPNPSRRSASYQRQSPFEGSNRQMRSRILKYLLAEGATTPARIVSDLDFDKEQTNRNLQQMEAEGLLKKKHRSYRV